MIHAFTEREREYYDLESFYGAAEQVQHSCHVAMLLCWIWVAVCGAARSLPLTINTCEIASHMPIFCTAHVCIV